MSTDKAIFKTPPAREVSMAVQFANNLAISDSRAKFYSSVKHLFPQVIIPEQKNLQYDFGDYSLYTEDQFQHLEVSMNYFRLVSTRYMGFKKFRAIFIEGFEKLAQCYDITTLASLGMVYYNKLPLGERSLGDCFDVGLVIPQSIKGSFLTGSGNLAFQEKDAWVSVDLKAEAQEGTVASYNMNLSYISLVKTELSDEALKSKMDAAHDCLRTYFFALLKDTYVEYLKDL